MRSQDPPALDADPIDWQDSPSLRYWLRDHLPDVTKKVSSSHPPMAEGAVTPFSWAVPAFSLPVDPIEFWAAVFLVGWWILM